MGLGTGVVFVLAGLLFSTEVVELPGPLDSRAIDLGLAVLGAVIIVIALSVHAARHRDGGPGA